MVKIFLNAGHHLKDEGAIVNGFQENLINMAIREEVKKLLPNALYVPDELNLKESIKWVLARGIDKTSICIDLHQNSHPNASQRGVEAYYWQDPTTAECFSRNVAESVGLSNRGYFPDTQTAVGSLGWIRQLLARSVVLECGYLSNPYDRQILISANGQRNIAKGIYNACVELGYPKDIITEPVKPMDWNYVIGLLRKAGMSFDAIVAWIKRFFNEKYA